MQHKTCRASNLWAAPGRRLVENPALVLVASLEPVMKLELVLLHLELKLLVLVFS